MSLAARFASLDELDEFKRALQQRYPRTTWTRYLHLHSAWIKSTTMSTITLHYWHGTTSLWLSGDAVEQWHGSDEFTQLRQQASDAAAQSSTGPSK